MVCWLVKAVLLIFTFNFWNSVTQVLVSPNFIRCSPGIEPAFSSLMIRYINWSIPVSIFRISLSGSVLSARTSVVSSPNKTNRSIYLNAQCVTSSFQVMYRILHASVSFPLRLVIFGLVLLNYEYHCTCVVTYNNRRACFVTYNNRRACVVTYNDRRACVVTSVKFR